MLPIDAAWLVLKQVGNPAWEAGMRRVQERKARGFLQHGAEPRPPRAQSRGRYEFGDEGNILEHHPLAGMSGYDEEGSDRYDLPEDEEEQRSQVSYYPMQMPVRTVPPMAPHLGQFGQRQLQSPTPPAIGERGRTYPDTQY